MTRGSNYDPWLSSEDLELLTSKSCRKMNHRKLDKNKRPKRNTFTRIIPFFGCILIALGVIGIVGALSSPFSLVGGILYLTTGIFISLTYSSFLRQSFLKLLSPSTKALLFQR
jgi:membrane-bound ClpP family serine protease